LTWGALAEMRTVLVELRPGAITEMELGELVRQLAQAATARSPVLDVDVHIEGEGQLPPEVQEVFYRVAQEALNNVVKHADARRIEVHLARRPEVVQLTVSDDGHGFEPLEVAPGHLGLGIMRERVDSIGGVFALRSSAESGTQLQISWSEVATTE
jgi:signal transduction histidine kinase